MQKHSYQKKEIRLYNIWKIADKFSYSNSTTKHKGEVLKMEEEDTLDEYEFRK